MNREMLKTKIKCIRLILKANIIMVTHSTEWDADAMMIREKSGKVTKLDMKA